MNRASVSILKEFTYGVVPDAREEISGIEGKKIVFYSARLERYASSLKDVETALIAVDDGESLKTMENVLSMVREMNRNGISRRDHVIALGGGTVTDTVGFATSIYKRGIRLVNVPTTLLSMVDAAIGGKTAVDFDVGKNMLGTFYFPDEILVDMSFLNSLPDEAFRDGLAETAKYGFIMDRDLHGLLLDHVGGIIARSPGVLEKMITSAMEDKIRIFTKDPLDEKGIRAILNFGHTVGHAVEAASGFKVTHGMAISIGMVMESRFAEDAGIVSAGTSATVKDTLGRFGLPTEISSVARYLDPGSLRDSHHMDKKASGKHLSLPVLSRIGSAKTIEIDTSELEAYIERKLIA